MKVQLTTVESYARALRELYLSSKKEGRLLPNEAQISCFLRELRELPERVSVHFK